MTIILSLLVLQPTPLAMAGDKAIQVANVAEKVIDNFRNDPFERMRVIYQVELRPFQWEWFFLMDEYPDIVAYSCMRVGKTVAIQVKHLDENVLHPDEEEMVFAPKYDQAVNTRKVQNDIIERSPILKAYLRKLPNGKPNFGQGEYQLYNNSISRCFGASSNFEGENATKQHIDELDDIPGDLLKRVFGRATGENKNGLPTRHRLSGVIWGKLNIYRFDKNPDYFTLPPVNVYQGIAAGYLSHKDVIQQRQEMSDEEWLRTQCLIFVEARNFIWESRLKMAQMVGFSWRLFPAPPHPGLYERVKGERIAFGLDMGAQGAGDDSSDYSLQVVSSVGPYRRWLYGKTWPGTADPEVIIGEVCEIWRFFRPDGGYGDSLDANLISQINDRLYELNLTYYNWRIAGPNVLEGWSQWARRGLLTPLNNQGRTKHHFYNSLKKCIDNSVQLAQLPPGAAPAGSVMIFPQIDRYKARHLEHWRELQILLRELANLQAERVPSGYYKISRIVKKIEDKELKFDGKSKLGDDRADALAMANYFMDYLQQGKKAAYGAAAVRGV